MDIKEKRQYIKKIVSQLETLLAHLSVSTTVDQRDVCRDYAYDIVTSAFNTIRMNPNVNEVEYIQFEEDLTEVFRNKKIRVPGEKREIINKKVGWLRSYFEQYITADYRQQRDLLKKHIQIKLSSAIHNLESDPDVIEVTPPKMGGR